MKGGGQGPVAVNPNCKTLPNNCNSPGGGPALHPHHSLKFNKSGALETVAPSEPISSAIVKYNYQAQQLDELSLVKGARIMILEKSGDGWWRGQCANKIGWFPSNYTQVSMLYNPGERKLTGQNLCRVFNSRCEHPCVCYAIYFIRKTAQLKVYNLAQTNSRVLYYSLQL